MSFSHDDSWDKFKEILSNKETLEDKWKTFVKFHEQIQPKDFWKDLYQIDL